MFHYQQAKDKRLEQLNKAIATIESLNPQIEYRVAVDSKNSEIVPLLDARSKALRSADQAANREPRNVLPPRQLLF